jgi:hypothetical protein
MFFSVLEKKSHWLVTNTIALSNKKVFFTTELHNEQWEVPDSWIICHF